jgi:hypothetical protein
MLYLNSDNNGYLIKKILEGAVSSKLFIFVPRRNYNS